MNDLGRTITGIVTILLGVILILIPVFVKEVGAFVTLIYGIPVLIIGFFIFFNKKENEIERRKDITK